MPSDSDTEASNSEGESLRALLLQHAEHFCKLDKAESQCRPIDPSLETALRPMQKKVLRVLQDPDMFWDGCVDLPYELHAMRSSTHKIQRLCRSTPAKETKFVKRRRRRKKKRASHGALTTIADSGQDKSIIREAIKELEAGNQQLKLSLHQAGI